MKQLLFLSTHQKHTSLLSSAPLFKVLPSLQMLIDSEQIESTDRSYLECPRVDWFKVSYSQSFCILSSSTSKNKDGFLQGECITSVIQFLLQNEQLSFIMDSSREILSQAENIYVIVYVNQLSYKRTCFQFSS